MWSFLDGEGNPPAPYPLHNDSIDVAIKGCFSGYDTVACIRRSLLSFLMLITFVFCCIKISRFHLVRHEQIHHYVILYMALVECIICIVNWMLSGHYPELDLVATALKVLQLVTLCHFHWSQTWRILHKEFIAQRLWFPLMGLFSTYIIVVAAVGILDTGPSWVECLRPYWLMLSAADLIGVQLFLIAGLYITQKINAVSTLECVKKTQKRNLWTIIIAFEFSALMGLTYDIVVKILGDENIGCSGVFFHTQAIYSPVFFIFMVFKFCLPIWSLLIVLEPLPMGVTYNEILATSHSASTSGACSSHTGSPYRVLRAYVYDDNSEVLETSGPLRGRRSLRRLAPGIESPNATTRALFGGQVVDTIYVPGHGHITSLASPESPAPRIANPRDYWRSRQRLILERGTNSPDLSVISEESQSQTTVASHSDPGVRTLAREEDDPRRPLVEVHRSDDGPQSLN